MHPVEMMSPPSYTPGTENRIDTLMHDAVTEPNIPAKKTIYATIYKTLLNLPKSEANEMKLIALLNAYATRTCYAQGLEGFQKCARFMQFSLCRSLTLLGLKSESQVLLPPTLEALETHLLQQTHLFEIWNERLNPEVLFIKAHEISSLVKNALVYLAYSYQNIDLFNVSTLCNLQIHFTLNELAKKFLDPQESVEFAYHRDPFMITLINPEAKQERHQCYVHLIEKFKAVFPEQEASGKEAQIINAFGLTILKEGGPIAEAKACFQKAAIIRSKLLPPTHPTQIENEKHHYANLISNLLYCLCMEKNQVEARPHYEWLKNYVQELQRQENQNSYIPSYNKAMGTYEKTFN